MSEPPSPTSPSAAAASAGDVLERRKTEVIRKLAAHVPSDDGDPIRLKKLGIIEKVLASFEDPNMNSDYLDEINNFHSYRYQPMTSTLAYLDNIEQRLQLLKDIKTTKLKYTDPEVPPKALPAELITHVVWAAFMAAPIDALQTLLNNMQSGRVGYHALTDALGQVETNLPILIHIKRCVLLGTTDPHVAHIFSHAAISHVSMYRSKLNCLATIWGDARINRYQEAHGESLDVPQNMLSLNYTVHHRWDKAQVAFEPIGQVNNSTIRVRLHLLEDTKLRSLKRKRDSSRDEFQWRNDLAQDPRETLKPFKDQFSSPSPLELRLVSSVTQHIVRDGHIFDIKARNPAHLPSYELLDLQYRICLMATLLGGGETSDEYLSESDADNEGQARLSDSKKILVDQWFQRMETDPVDLATAVIERLEEEKAIEEAWGEPS
ncbi:Integral membrane protein [Colletotrichum higginsianum IMI 349063]|uniref:Integral membrane protein n=1 Tax=Colletotrichum higginsianum (strain IMI 349063) TaxID=759273 RepID=A0A1B7XYJ5_COLHI|nr:Integral membrane protein [Colletotrichum higginsianum IMI 349063]OBR04819.1 Integral membrane protein [Colletotrichum higginsianum IMI 349063]